MKTLLICLCIALANAAYFEETFEKFKNYKGNFQVKLHEQFKGWTKEQIKGLMGTKRDRKPNPSSEMRPEPEAIDIGSIPDSFNVDQKWPSCKSTFDYIKDQAQCGSCWAVAASNVIGGRICIAHGGPDPNVNYNSNGRNLNEPAPAISFSAQQICSCCLWCGNGCDGGYPIDAMKYAQQFGVVTGGWYNSNCGCYPYEVDPTSWQSSPTPPCHKTTCRNSNFNGAFNDDKHYASNYYSLGAMANPVAELQAEIMNHGPIECAFDVYQNFMYYSGGVYDHTEGNIEGGHAVTAYGWGTLNGIPYWTFHNSWNVTWGLGGKFLFKRGGDLCGMESQCVAARFKGLKSSWGLKC